MRQGSCNESSERGAAGRPSIGVAWRIVASRVVWGPPPKHFLFCSARHHSEAATPVASSQRAPQF
uniref:Uncharacterized protein n=1 Tax=Arundo donax TaxID=35708 RepID=A0A0A8Y642_ARUDO